MTGERAKIEFLLDVANLLNADLFFTRKRLDEADIRMVTSLNARAIRALATEVIIPLAAMDGLCQRKRNGPFTDSFRPDKQVGMMQPAIGQSRTQDFHLPLMTKDFRKAHYTSSRSIMVLIS